MSDLKPAPQSEAPGQAQWQDCGVCLSRLSLQCPRGAAYEQHQASDRYRPLESSSASPISHQSQAIEVSPASKPQIKLPSRRHWNRGSAEGEQKMAPVLPGLWKGLQSALKCLEEACASGRSHDN